MGLCLLAMLCCLMASTALFNGALSASPSFVLMGLCLLDRGIVLMEPLSATNV